MVHERKIASKEQVDKELNRSIEENQGLLKRLEMEEMKSFIKEKYIVGDIPHLENPLGEGIILQTVQIPTTSTQYYYESAKKDVRSTTSHNKSELEILE